MTEYIYKGFKISYKIMATGQEEYKADGTATYLLKKDKKFIPVKFHTELDTYDRAEYEIKSLLEQYVDFELKHYYETEK
ncbi:hypothetical protein [Legionella impletisoli]|uniref:Uncharacterized protein n=1 Tax=Legionella impletisoli TaxID=343510 RepID=A0A917NBK7_9GAMM|nr:hypothetical protein [Legionella impletisoli]GGI84791.1 hypothetical protein GCM10007966_11730 [Legionella impletisoli]